MWRRREKRGLGLGRGYGKVEERRSSGNIVQNVKCSNGNGEKTDRVKDEVEMTDKHESSLPPSLSLSLPHYLHIIISSPTVAMCVLFQVLLSTSTVLFAMALI